MQNIVSVKNNLVNEYFLLKYDLTRGNTCWTSDICLRGFSDPTLVAKEVNIVCYLQLKKILNV